MAQTSSAYDSVTFGNSLSLRVDGGVGAVSINPSGRDVVLAGRRGLYVVDLDDPFSPPRWLHHLTSWEVADVQWSPHPSKPSWVISTSNQKALLWNLARSGDNAIEHVLHGHQRAITDINFHPDHPELLATCSIDTFVLAWDMRVPETPIYTVADWRAGASQVKWNFQNPNILSSSHDNYFYIWDIRNNTKPLHRIDAHERKINGVDFHKKKENEIISCSNDGTVKFWDIAKDTENPVAVINTEFPVWRARHLPFGDGCSIMPLRGGQNSVYLTASKDLKGTSKLRPLYSFKGHTDRVTDFLWRSRNTNSGIDDREFQLVTWSKDCDLRLWRVNEDIYDKVGHVKGQPLNLPERDYKTYREEPGTISKSHITLKKTKDTFVSSRGAEGESNTANHLDWISGVRIGRSAFAPPIDQNPNISLDSTPENLGEEVSYIGHKFPKVSFEKISVSTGALILSLNGPWSNTPDELLFLRVEIKFPMKEYPNSPPSFRIEENRDLDKDKRQEMLQTLNNIAKAYANVGRFSLEVCLRFLMGEKIEYTNIEKDTGDFDMTLDNFGTPSSLPSSIASSDAESDSESDVEDDELLPMMVSEVSGEPTFDSTPIPKGCGATWTKTGQLVCFFIPKRDSNVQKNVKSHQNGLNRQVFFDNDDLSDDSLSEDWNDVLQKDSTARSKISGVFRIQNYGSTVANSVPTDKSSNTHHTIDKNVVAVFDMRHLIPSKMELADEYKIIGDTPEKLSLHNSEISAKYGYTDLAESWRILSTIFSPNFYWGTHPFGRFWFVKEMMKYYENLGNVQMLAMITCIIQGSQRFMSTGLIADMETLPYVHNVRHSKVSITNSTTYSESNYRLPFSRSSSVATREFEQKHFDVKIQMMNEGNLGYAEDTFLFTLLDTQDEIRFNRYRDEYANMLYIWGQILRRAEILKFNQESVCLKDDPHKGKFSWINGSDKDCIYCGLKVVRRLFACDNCGHVLHADCASSWFNISDECASGCGCNCLEEYREKQTDS